MADVPGTVHINNASILAAHDLVSSKKCTNISYEAVLSLIFKPDEVSQLFQQPAMHDMKLNCAALLQSTDDKGKCVWEWLLGANNTATLPGTAIVNNISTLVMALKNHKRRSADKRKRELKLAEKEAESCRLSPLPSSSLSTPGISVKETKTAEGQCQSDQLSIETPAYLSCKKPASALNTGTAVYTQSPANDQQYHPEIPERLCEPELQDLSLPAQLAQPSQGNMACEGKDLLEVSSVSTAASICVRDIVVVVGASMDAEGCEQDATDKLLQPGNLGCLATGLNEVDVQPPPVMVPLLPVVMEIIAVEDQSNEEGHVPLTAAPICEGGALDTILDAQGHKINCTMTVDLTEVTPSVHIPPLALNKSDNNKAPDFSLLGHCAVSKDNTSLKRGFKLPAVDAKHASSHSVLRTAQVPQTSKDDITRFFAAAKRGVARVAGLKRFEKIAIVHTTASTSEGLCLQSMKRKLQSNDHLVEAPFLSQKRSMRGRAAQVSAPQKLCTTAQRVVRMSKAVVRGRNSLGGRDAGAKLLATGVRSRQDSSTHSAGYLCDEDGVRIEDIDGKSAMQEDALKQQLWVKEGGYCIIPTSAATFPELLERLLCDHSLHQVKPEEGLNAVVDLFMCSNSIFQDFDRKKNPLTDGDQRQMIVIDEAEAVVSQYGDSQAVESCIVHPQVTIILANLT
ncbi:hypothetical protein CEUSTIGMA_g13593.t1 [Chlamydomonas eustigma]|uniref:Uncharacterized protein n=1 Tax=Chlamydomonas eustigma TaxID=1157962 RepID=A0A250XTQ3_9CHLO|nr:hypothetical protein CEUSTIGMA_g13593.t1 [Chlamydomonas eustigma]|eukprot:GAX86180.1 hypothetical protein CEUSTIGMA_g13593.t1 [Chlamydomonas eustigma]